MPSRGHSVFRQCHQALFYKQTQKGDYHSKNLVGRENLHLINTMEIYGIAFKGVLYVVVEI